MRVMARKKSTRTIVTDIFGLSYGGSLGINSKDKGDSNERELCKWLCTWTGERFVRTPSSGGRRLKNASNFCGDVVCEEENFDFPFAVETKHYKKFTFSSKLRANSLIYTIYFQAKADALRANKAILMALRYNGMPKLEWVLYFTFPLPDLEILSKGTPEDGVTIYGYHSNEILKINFDNIKKIASFTQNNIDE